MAKSIKCLGCKKLLKVAKMKVHAANCIRLHNTFAPAPRSERYAGVRQWVKSIALAQEEN